MSNLSKIRALCDCIERLLEIVDENAEAAEVEKEYREIIREED